MHDAHCHPFDLAQKTDGDEAEILRRTLKTPCAASSWGAEDFAYNLRLAENAAKDGCAPVYLSFAVHPQLPAAGGGASAASFALLAALANEGRLDAVGETGFDLFDSRYRSTEKEQDALFAGSLEIAARHDLPVIVHARKAMHKIFAAKKALKKIKAVIMHSYPGTECEASALLAGGVNIYFSFGAALLNNHKQAQRAAAFIPAERLLFETDAPYQPPRGEPFSLYRHIQPVMEKTAALRREAGHDFADWRALESLADGTFFRLFGGKG